MRLTRIVGALVALILAATMVAGVPGARRRRRQAQARPGRARQGDRQHRQVHRSTARSRPSRAARSRSCATSPAVTSGSGRRSRPGPTASSARASTRPATSGPASRSRCPATEHLQEDDVAEHRLHLLDLTTTYDGPAPPGAGPSAMVISGAADQGCRGDIVTPDRPEHVLEGKQHAPQSTVSLLMAILLAVTLSAAFVLASQASHGRRLHRRHEAQARPGRARRGGRQHQPLRRLRPCDHLPEGLHRSGRSPTGTTGSTARSRPTTAGKFRTRDLPVQATSAPASRLGVPATSTYARPSWRSAASTVT